VAEAQLVDPLLDPGWARLVAAHELGSIFASPPWMAALRETYGFDVEAAVLHGDGGDIVAGLPFCHIEDPRGERLRCLAFSDYCDPMADEAELGALLARVLERGAPVVLRVLRDVAARAHPALEEVGGAAWHGVDLALGADALWANLGGSGARNIRRAERLGVQVRVGATVDDVRAFHGLHCRLRKAKHHLLAQPLAFFEALHRHFAPLGAIHVRFAEWEGEVVAGTLFLDWGGTRYYKFNASLDTTCRPNDLLAWEGIRSGCEAGLRRFDFGLSDLDQPGLLRFKAKFATEERRISTLASPGRTPAPPWAADFGRALGELTSLLTRPDVPDQVTDEAGALLYRYFA
jgi:CelD/BcsL family acetyltransferase involved in cellulose biosynthesis